ncbi:MAG: YjgN family protein [Firmicutes bacterium]|nr:YjgN family protein [Bacillota bacterium]
MESKFSGGLLGLIGISILSSFLIVFTLGIGTPWAVCMVHRWYTKHTVIDGRQLTFTGTGGALFGKFIKWWLLTIITLGIFGLWLGLRMKAWVVSHTHVAN